MDHLLSLSLVEILGYVMLSVVAIVMMQTLWPRDVVKDCKATGLKPAQQLDAIVAYFRQRRVGLPWMNMCGILLYALVVAGVLHDVLTFYHRQAVVQNQIGYFYLDSEGKKRFAYCYRMCSPEVLPKQEPRK